MFNAHFFMLIKPWLFWLKASEMGQISIFVVIKRLEEAHVFQGKNEFQNFYAVDFSVSFGSCKSEVLFVLMCWNSLLFKQKFSNWSLVILRLIFSLVYQTNKYLFCNRPNKSSNDFFPDSKVSRYKHLQTSVKFTLYIHLGVKTFCRK